MAIKKMTIQINKEKNEICILLNKDFYNLEEIRNALEDFYEVCDGKIFEEEKHKIKIVLKPKEHLMIEMLGHEFCNYSLGLMKNKTLV